MPTLDRDGVTIAYDVHGGGAGLPLLLTHGFGSSAAVWETNLASLAAHRRLVTWDLRGHGHSGSPSDPGAYSRRLCIEDMTAVLDACAITRAVVGGLSLGGYLSLAFHLAHPERVGALLLVDTGPGYSKTSARRRWNAWAMSQADRLESVGLSALSDISDGGPGPHDPAGLARAARGILTQHDDLVIRSLPAIDIPTSVVVGADDEAFRPAADYLASTIPGAVLTVVPGAGHTPNIEKPAVFYDVAHTFLASADRTEHR